MRREVEELVSTLKGKNARLVAPFVKEYPSRLSLPGRVLSTGARSLLREQPAVDPLILVGELGGAYVTLAIILVYTLPWLCIV